MNFRPTWDKLSTTRSGRVAMGTVLAMVSFLVIKGCQPATSGVVSVDAPVPESVGGTARPTRELPQPRPPLPGPSPKTPKVSQGLAPINLYVAATAAEPVARPRLPSRRLIPCKLVNTIESSSLETPIIGLVAEDIWFGDRVVIPRSTEVHGQAQSQYMRDRIASRGPWTLIWPGGEETTVIALALDYDRTNDTWGVTDGSAGLRGIVRKADNLEELKLFAATFLNGMTESFKEQKETPLGFHLVPNSKNAALAGTGEVIQRYSERLFESLERNSVFVRVAAGTRFYLYPLEPITEPSVEVSNQP